ncbi:tetratricopeptide repeat protein [Vibrio nigripulchritudo]|uniref:tetratricopeptide repeat protein n=1 Tax=Vibrio nigripulchritudo TaxID=28173 RepID=UPI002490FAFD|nr:tetratricopeptide repeat protein [Vibrio nigripulchritudo]BDU36996.1 pilus assembly protein TadD [Vibrio nigripulchritudo]BDU42706.1 pilus assembly protein TadD [Vibrio nigripulchritudo]
MASYKYVLLMVLLLGGCASTNNELDTKEDLLLRANDKTQLVEFYKSNLKENDEYKIKLVNLYIDLKDTSSAELYLNTFSESEKDEPEIILADAKIAYLKRNYARSELLLETYLKEGGDKYQHHILMGQIKAQQRQFGLAIDYFEQSRKLGASDREAKNSIAVVHLMQGRYQEAMVSLYDLYLDQPNDEKVRSNLILASVNASRPDIALDALREKYPEEEARRQLKKLMKSVKKKPNPLLARAHSTPMQPVAVNHQMKAEDNALYKPHSQLQSAVVAVDRAGNHQSVAGKVVFNPDSLKPKTPSIYRIQVLATYKAISSEYLNYLRDNYGTVYAYSHNLWKRYCIGEFDSVEEAKAYLDRIQIKGAFVVDYTKNRHIEL